MDIKTDADLTKEVVRSIRKDLGLSLERFWRPIGITRATGFRYETDLNMPTPIRRLIFVNYVAGISTDTSDPDCSANIVHVGHLQHAERAALVILKMKEAGSAIQKSNKPSKA